MKVTLKVLITFSFVFVFNTIAISQESTLFKQQELKSYQIDKHIYNFYWHKNYINANNYFHKREVLEGDMLPYFVDDREYKGLHNYGIEHANLDETNSTLTENFKMYYLDVAFEDILFNPKDSIIKINGTVEKAWSKKDFGHPIFKDWNSDNSVKVFIGQKKDTIHKLYYEPYLTNTYSRRHKVLDKQTTYTELYSVDGSTTKYIVKYKGKEIKNITELDSFPSFYLENFDFYNTNSGEIREFEIETKIDSNSILAFSLENCYTEIFEIGKLVFDDDETRRKKVKQFKKQKLKKNTEDYKVIIRNNIQELYKDTISASVIPWYYQKVEAAENYLMKGQFGAARNEYNTLLVQEHYIYARDMHNAVRTSIISRDYNTAIVWSQKLVLKGVPLTYFDAQIFKRLKKTKLWSSFLSEFPELAKQHEEGLNQKLIIGLKELIDMDQRDYTRQARGEFERSKLKATTEQVDELFIKLIREEGFPSEEKIGVKIFQDTMISKSNDFYVLITHSHQASSEKLPKIQMIINNSFKKFEYDKKRNNLSEFMNMRTCFMMYKRNLYNDKTCLLNNKELQKIKFSFQNKHGFIVDEGQFSVLGFSKENETEDIKFMYDNFNFIMKLTNEMYLSK